MTSRRASTIKQTQASITSYVKPRKTRRNPEAPVTEEIQEMSKLISKQKGTAIAFKEMVSGSTKSKSGVKFAETSALYPHLPSVEPTYASDSDLGHLSDSQYDHQSDEQDLTTDPNSDYNSEQDVEDVSQIEQEQRHSTNRCETIGMTAVRQFEKCEHPLSEQLRQILTNQQMTELNDDIEIAWDKECRKIAKIDNTDIDTLTQNMKYSWVGIQLDSSMSMFKDMLEADTSSLSVINTQRNKLTTLTNRIDTLNKRFNETTAENERVHRSIIDLAETNKNVTLAKISDHIRNTGTTVKVVQELQYDDEITTDDFDKLPGNAAVLVNDAAKARQISETAKAELDNANDELQAYETKIGHSLDDLTVTVNNLNERQHDLKQIIENIKATKREIPNFQPSSVKGVEISKDIPKHELEATIRNLDSTFNSLSKSRNDFVTFRGGRRDLKANVQNAEKMVALAQKFGRKFNFNEILKNKLV